MNKPTPFLKGRCACVHHLYLFAWAVILFLCTAGGPAQAAEVPALSSVSDSGQTAMLRVANRDIIELRAEADKATPKQRVQDIQARISRLTDADIMQPPALQQVTFGGQNAFLITIGGKPLFVVLESDRDPLSDRPVEDLARTAVKHLAEAMRILREQRQPKTIIYGLLRGLAGTVLFAGALWVMLRFWRRMHRSTDRLIARRLNWLDTHGLDISKQALQIGGYALKLLLWLAILFASYLWITFLLGQFPYTQPWGNALAMNVVNLLAWVGAGILSAAPSIATIFVIFFIAHIVVQTLHVILHSVEEEKVSLPFIYPDTVAATRWLASVLIWVFALAAAYPFIPGSHNVIFQGISVVVGLMATLGSAGIINQGMSGLILIYSRALTKGEVVQIGDTEGCVVKVSLLSTKLENFRHEEFTIPNAVIVGSQIKNYSRMEKSKGSTVSALVSIGYDTPWRQVAALLQQASKQTDGIRQEIPAQVLMRKLSDFYIEYELVAPIIRPVLRATVLSELHGKILDLFNEYGVQIMSPNFEAQPEGKVYVAKEDWFIAPATVNEPQGNRTAQ